METYPTRHDEGLPGGPMQLPYMYSAAFCRFCVREARVSGPYLRTTECPQCGKAMDAVIVTITAIPGAGC